MSTRPLAALAAGLVACVALSGCTVSGGNGAHDVLLGAKADGAATTLRYQIGNSAPVTVQPNPSSGGSAGTSVDLRVRAGTHVSILGTAGAVASPDITCTVAVDGIVRATTTALQPAGVPLLTPVSCQTATYVLHRPYGINRVLEIVAFVLCLLIVITAIGALFVPRRRP